RMRLTTHNAPSLSVDTKHANFVSVETKRIDHMTAVLPAPAFTRDQCAIGLRAAVNILEKWQATTEQACSILRISRSTHARAKLRNDAWSVNLDPDQMQRVSFVLNIHAALRLLFDNPENVYGFPAM